jgi:hypothetical protein
MCALPTARDSDRRDWPRLPAISSTMHWAGTKRTTLTGAGVREISKD